MTVLGFLIMLGQFQDIHTYANADVVRTTHLSLDLTLDFEKRVISGSNTMTLAYQGKAEFIDLDSDRLTIQKVSDPQGKTYRFEVGPKETHMGNRLRIFLENGAQPEKLTVIYHSDPSADAVQWLPPQATTSGKLPFLFTQSQSTFARTWIPCMDSPGVRVTYDAVIHAPKDIVPVMSARHGKHEPAKGTYRFSLDLAIPVYLIALAAGELEFQEIGPRTGVYAEPGVLRKAAWEFADMEKMVEAAEAGFGPYRWGRWDAIVLPPSFPFGGMENPLLTFVTPTLIAGDRSLVSVMAHELAHSWSGNLVTNATWADFWLNEGYTTYLERRIVESLYGKDIAEMQKLLGQRDLHELVAELKKDQPNDTKLHLDLKGRHPDDGMTEIAYEKGANLLMMLEKHFGRAAFDAYLRSYFDGHAFQSITTADGLAYMKKTLFKGDEAAWKAVGVERWVYETGVPDTIVVPVSDKFEKTRAASAAFASKGDTSGIQKTWVTAEWLDFLNSLPEKVSAERLSLLDQNYKLSQQGNSEILFAWLMVAVRNSFEPAYPACEKFLTHVGRRKFLKPLYTALQANPNTRALGKQIYTKARPGYHPIAISTIDEIVR